MPYSISFIKPAHCVTYLIFEALAAESRALPDSLGVASQALNTHTSSSTNAVYEAFQKIQGTINTTNPSSGLEVSIYKE